MSKRKTKWWQKERNDEMAKSDKSSNALPPVDSSPPVTLRPMLYPSLLGPSPSAVAAPAAPAPVKMGPPEEIADPEFVLRLGMLDERLRRLTMEKQVKLTNYNTRLVSLQTEGKNAIKQLETEETATTQEIKNLRDLLSKKHGVDLSLYGYNDATGTLNLLPAQPNNDAVQGQATQA